MSAKHINRLIASLKDHSYHPNPARRTYIQKNNNPQKKRPLGIPSFDDKLLQEVVRMILESIYEGNFSRHSHGFRPNYSCHTALMEVKHKFIGTKWFIEGDIKGCFDNVDHAVLINLLRRRIKDEYFISLIWKFLKAGYMEDWVYHNTYSGTPQGSIISPILANIYLHELDYYMQRKIERTIRRKKREVAACEAAGLTDEAAAAKSYLRRLNQEYRDFSRAAGLPEQRERLRSLYADDVSAKKAAKALEKRTDSGIIDTNRSREIPEVNRTAAPRRELKPKDVTKEYFETATPGQGTVTYEDGFKFKDHKGEINMAKWLNRTFGGNVKLLKEASSDSIKRPDYLWNAALWELKGTSSISSADKLLQYAIKQIHDNPGGVIINILADMDMPALERQLTRRIMRSKIDALDMMVLIKGTIYKILRYKK